MISFDEIGMILNNIADELPENFYKKLNGGINLLPDVKMHPESKESGDLFILGEYYNDQQGLGRYINIYYGSFMRLYAHLEPASQREELKHILLHEFTHHLESLAGEEKLKIKDIQDLERYKQEFK